VGSIGSQREADLEEISMLKEVDTMAARLNSSLKIKRKTTQGAIHQKGLSLKKR
jgi:23S rRNA maturation-related 3'-5' exoribonuclease YhaM